MRTLLAAAIGATTVAYIFFRRRRSVQPQRLVLTLVGFGSVNRALARLIASEEAVLRDTHGLVVVYRAIIARL